MCFWLITVRWTFGPEVKFSFSESVRTARNEGCQRRGRGMFCLRYTTGYRGFWSGNDFTAETQRAQSLGMEARWFRDAPVLLDPTLRLSLICRARPSCLAAELE